LGTSLNLEKKIVVVSVIVQLREAYVEAFSSFYGIFFLNKNLWKSYKNM
jgi:hypothetical protein